MTQTMKMFQLLEWDTQVFAHKVARLLLPRFTLIQLEGLLATLKRQDVRLVYWASDSQHLESQIAAEKLGGILADQKATYLAKLAQEDKPYRNLIESYKEETPSDELIELALESGMYSRFVTDPNISRELFERVYRLWIENSTRRIIADDVLVVRRGDHLAGMVTVGEKAERGDIGLLAVAKDFRGQGIGKILVHAAKEYFSDQGYQFSQVVTQQSNIPAAKLYEHCGYQLERVENFYHFWL